MGTGSNPTPLSDRFTKAGLLAQLRELEKRLYSQRVVARVKKDLTSEQQQDFARSRLHLTEVIARLNASIWKDIRQQLEAQSQSLQTGVDSLSGSLAKLEGAAGWAKAVNGIIGIVGKALVLL